MSKWEANRSKQFQTLSRPNGPLWWSESYLHVRRITIPRIVHEELVGVIKSSYSNIVVNLLKLWSVNILENCNKFVPGWKSFWRLFTWCLGPGWDHLEICSSRPQVLLIAARKLPGTQMNSFRDGFFPGTITLLYSVNGPSDLLHNSTNPQIFSLAITLAQKFIIFVNVYQMRHWTSVYVSRVGLTICTATGRKCVITEFTHGVLEPGWNPFWTAMPLKGGATSHLITS